MLCLLVFVGFVSWFLVLSSAVCALFCFMVYKLNGGTWTIKRYMKWFYKTF